ncbi:ABC transporter permease, partial [Acinetobacter baumannii]|nr:ABC transporter permease [Acinetobacter baumannii]
MKILVKPLIEQNNDLFKTPLRKKFSSKKVYGLLSVISPLLVFLIWHLISSLQVFPTQILVPPKTVWNTFIALLQSGELQ